MASEPQQFIAPQRTVTPEAGSRATFVTAGLAAVVNMFGGMGSPFATLIFYLFQSGEDKKALDLANAAAEEDDQAIREQINQLGNEGVEAAREIGRMGVDAAIKDFKTAQRNAGISSEDLRGFVQQTRQEYAARTERGLGLLEDVGQAERGDIKSFYADLAARTRSGIRRRGLGGATILESMSRGVGRDRTRELGLQRGREAALTSGVFGMLSGEELAATSGAERLRIAIEREDRSRVREAEQARSAAPARAVAMEADVRANARRMAIQYLQSVDHTFVPSTTNKDAVDAMTNVFFAQEMMKGGGGGKDVAGAMLTGGIEGAAIGGSYWPGWGHLIGAVGGAGRAGVLENNPDNQWLQMLMPPPQGKDEVMGGFGGGGGGTFGFGGGGGAGSATPSGGGGGGSFGTGGAGSFQSVASMKGGKPKPKFKTLKV